MTRIRNEELIIDDTIEHLAGFCDEIVVYDDCSTDTTVDRLLSACVDVPIHLIRGEAWRDDRRKEETRHRALLTQFAWTLDPDWVIYLDADERLDKDPRLISRTLGPRVSGIRFGLLDAYMTPECCTAYAGGRLADIRRKYGIEERRILTMWRSPYRFRYLGSDQREPVAAIGARIYESAAKIRHFGKAISVDVWEDTCRYYSAHFPEPYRSKWAARKGKALHNLSDLGGPLLEWDEAVILATPVAVRRSWRHLLRRAQVAVEPTALCSRRAAGSAGIVLRLTGTEDL